MWCRSVLPWKSWSVPFTIDAMEDASHKVNRSMKAAAMALGARWRFTTVSAICL